MGRDGGDPPGASREVPDAVLARRAGLGDREAFTVLFHRHGPAMFRYAMHMLDGQDQDAEDAVQSAWAKAWLHIGDFRGEAQLRTWLFKITASEVLNARRRRRPLLVDDELLVRHPDRPEERPDRQAGQLALRESLTLALAELTWRQRASWVLREVDGLSYEEIAHVLDTSVPVVRGQLHRGRNALALRMAQWR